MAGRANRFKGWGMSTHQHVAEPQQESASQLISRRQWLQTALAASVAAALARPGLPAYAQAAQGGAAATAGTLAPSAPVEFGATLELSALGGKEIQLVDWRQDFQALLLAAGPAAPTSAQKQPDDQPLRITKLVDAATPGLQQMAHSGTTSNKARLTLTRDGLPWLRADLDEVIIVAMRLTSQGEAGPTETLTLAYADAKWRLEPGLLGQLGAAHAPQQAYPQPSPAESK